jgi:hypothetical protein
LTLESAEKEGTTVVAIEITESISTADVLPTEGTVKAEGQNAAATTTAEKIADLNKKLYALLINTDEEINYGSTITCDGECGGSYGYWSEPIYLCIYCPSTDLCIPCYDKRVAQNRGEPKLHWRSYCGKNHRYLKGPIQGWKGIKDGAMRIEGKDGIVEEVDLKEWLRGLKEERWIKAWDNFWLKSADVGDIVY